MNVFFPTFVGDSGQLKNLLVWIGQLGGCKGHSAFIMADRNTPAGRLLELRSEAQKHFDSVSLIATEQSVTGWPQGPNMLWLACARYAKGLGLPWLFMEPDAVPLSKGWLDELESDYKASGKPYSGSIIKCDQNGLPPVHLGGVAIYPPFAYDELSVIVNQHPNQAFDVSTATATISMANNSPKFHQIWGEPGNPPTFSDFNRPGTNVFSPRQLKPGAVLFHRNKDGSLIELLRKKLGIVNGSSQLLTVLSFCNRDSVLVVPTLQWMLKMHGQLDRTVVIHTDMPQGFLPVKQIHKMASLVFKNVFFSQYSPPSRVDMGWPKACNYAFRAACRWVEKNWNGPWFWMEADVVPVKRNWLQILEDEYALGKKPFMGTLIGGMGHMNGVAVYPRNVVQYAPQVMTCNEAWDMAMKPAIVPHHVHKANHVIQHCRFLKDHCCDDSHGPPPKFTSKADLAAILPTASVFHPSKDNSLVKLLNQ